MEQKIKKVCELMERVIKLNENAKEYYFNFNFSGHTKQVTFFKMDPKTYNPVYHAYSYLDKPTLSVSLEDIEKLIEAEEKAQEEQQ